MLHNEEGLYILAYSNISTQGELNPKILSLICKVFIDNTLFFPKKGDVNSLEIIYGDS